MGELTTVVNKALDMLGFSKRMVQQRRAAYERLSEAQSKVHHSLSEQLSSTLTGSKREGLSGELESDFDLMLTFHFVRCMDAPLPATGDVLYMFELDRDGVPPGYTKLRLHDSNDEEINSLIENSLYEAPSHELYLSSSFYMDELQSASEESAREGNSFILSIANREQRSGPSLPRTTEEPRQAVQIKTDEVTSFPCECSEYLLSWLERPRKYEWPPAYLIQMAATLDSHVVPVGQKGAADEFSLWRICYTPAEIMLMKSLNETQWKLYALLRMLKEAAFPSGQDIITSYVLKNLVMWMAESNPEKEFQTHLLLDRLVQSVQVLRQCVEKSFLPSYMIHERNLFEGRLNAKIQSDYKIVLDGLLAEGPMMVLRCNKLKENIRLAYRNPRLSGYMMRARNNAEEVRMTTYKLPMNQLVEFLKSCQTAKTKEEYLAATMSPQVLRRLHRDPRYKKLLADIKLNSDVHFKRMLLSSDVERVMREGFTEETFFESSIQNAMNDPTLMQDMNQLLCHAFDSKGFHPFVERLAAAAASIELPTDLSLNGMLHFIEYAVAIDPEVITKLTELVHSSMQKNPEACMSIMFNIPSVPNSLKTFGANRSSHERAEQSIEDTDIMGTESSLGRLLLRK